MFSKEILEKYADIMLWSFKRSSEVSKTKINKGDIIQLSFSAPAIPLAGKIAAKLIQSGLMVDFNMRLTPEMEKDFYDLCSEEQLIFIPPWAKFKTKNIKGSINLHAPTCLDHLKNIDPKKIMIQTKAHKILRDILTKKSLKGEYCWALTSLPTAALARKAEISLKEYEEEVIRACYLDHPDPVSKWEEIDRQSQEIIKWLMSLNIKKLHIESENTDLFIYPGEHRKWNNGLGCNMPSFEIFISPDCRLTHGIYYADMEAMHKGKIAQGIRLEFKKGKADIDKISALKEEEFVKKMASADKGACMVGEFSLTDKRHSRISRFMANTLFDENTAGKDKEGNSHLAIGFSFPDATYSGTEKITKLLLKKLGFSDSAIHWDLINTKKKTVTAHTYNGQRIIIYENGMFTI